ncbi:MAG: carboxypeptidase-like regulatory domain-containing protein, partial [Bacteroidota bacterium]
MYKKLIPLLLLVLMPGILVAQDGTITGKVTDAATNDALPGANVMIVGTAKGASTLQDGAFEITNVPPGTYDIRVTYVGYQRTVQSVAVRPDAVVTVDFTLEPIEIQSGVITIFASRAVERETPVAFTDVSKADMEGTLGSRDIPLALETTPSFYATMQGGGAGDARLNVRGFDQRNVSIMINGVPQNDMENGWVYWSNWDGVGDVTSSIQVQRGLSAVNLATPSIGGTMNILTDPTALERGGKFKQ